MESKYHYFKRDISWLSFNYRVLLEADDDSLPLYERINFISIYSSNLEEFYKIRVAEHKAIASGGQSDDMTQEEYRKAAVDAVKKLSQDVGIPADLKEIVKGESYVMLSQEEVEALRKAVNFGLADISEEESGIEK
mgnify:CR=1 FL=1